MGTGHACLLGPEPDPDLHGRLRLGATSPIDRGAARSPRDMDAAGRDRYDSAAPSSPGRSGAPDPASDGDRSTSGPDPSRRADDCSRIALAVAAIWIGAIVVTRPPQGRPGRHVDRTRLDRASRASTRRLRHAAIPRGQRLPGLGAASTTGVSSGRDAPHRSGRPASGATTRRPGTSSAICGLFCILEQPRRSSRRDRVMIRKAESAAGAVYVIDAGVPLRPSTSRACRDRWRRVHRPLGRPPARRPRRAMSSRSSVIRRPSRRRTFPTGRAGAGATCPIATRRPRR